MKLSWGGSRWIEAFFIVVGIIIGSGHAMAQRPLGIDVSSYQGSGINWASVKASGVTFAFVKAAEGTLTDGYIGQDPDFTINMAHAKAAGVIVGAYYYAHPEVDVGLAGADAEAAFFWSVAGPYIKNGGAYMMPMLDFEQNVTGAGYTAATLSQWLNEWCQDVVGYAAANGVVVKPVVYTFISYANGTGGYGPGLDNTVTQWPLNMANVDFTNPQTGAPAATYPWSTWAFWQYNWHGSVPGVTGDCDLDVFDGTGATFTNNFIIGNGAAAIYYWDPQGTSGGNPYTGSMTGTWESRDWSSGPNGQATPTSWFEGQAVCFGVNTGLGTPPFTITANSNHVFAGMFDGPLAPNSCNVTINGSGILSLASGPQGFSMITASDGSQASMTISNQIAGLGQIVPEGYGQLYLYGANTFSGGTTLGYTGNAFSGFVNFNNGSSFGSGPITLTSLGNGASFVAQGTSAINIPNSVTVANTTTNTFVGNPAGVTFSGNWSLGGNVLTFGTGGGAGNIDNISGIISGTGGFTETGSGTLILSGANTYSGATTIGGGTLRLGAANSVPSGSSVFVANGAKFDMNGFSDSVATLGGAVGATLPSGNVINNNGTLTINGASVLNAGEVGSGAYSGVISGSGNVVISGGGSTTFSGANTYGGTTTVNGGILVPSRSGSLPAGSPIIVNSPGILDIVSVNETIPSLAGSGTINLESGTLTVGGGGFSGAVQNSAATYNNGASVNGLRGFYYPAINFSGTPTIRVDSTINFSDFTQASQNPLYPATNQFSVRWIGQVLTTGAAGTYTFTTKSDDGSRCWVNGVLVVDNWAFQPATSRSGTISLSANTKYDIRVEYMQGGGGASCVLSWTPPGGTSAVIPNSNLFTYGGLGGLTKTGAGTLTLTGTNTYGGNTTISAGTLALGGTGSISNTATISLAAGATFDVSAISSYTLSGSTKLSASGNSTPATINGGATVSLGSQPILLTYDGTDPALTISQGILSLNGNAFTVNGPQLAIGTYPIIQQASGNVADSGSHSVSGSVIAPGMAGAISASGGNVLLTIANATTTTLNSLSPSTYGQPVTFTATVAPAPSGGTVQFFDNGVPLGSPVAVSGGTASYATSTLSAGNHPITASFSGATSYAASSTASASAQQVSPAPLSITAGPQTKTYGTALTFGSGSTNFASTGLQNGETVGTVALAVSGNGGATNAPVGTYTITPSAATGGTFNPANYNITYNTGTLTVTLPPNTIPVTITGVTLLGGGAVQLNFTGTPGYVYLIEAATTLTPPPDWTILSTNAADSNGVFSFIDSSATNYNYRYYRTAAQ